MTCMNKHSFDMAFSDKHLRKIYDAQSCIATSWDTMNLFRIHEVDSRVKGKKFSHPVNVIKELNDNIISIDFIHKHKLIYDVINWQVKFIRISANTISAIKQTIWPALTSTVINAKFKDKAEQYVTYIKYFCNMDSDGLRAACHFNIDSYSNCKIIMEKCVLDNIAVKCNNIIRLIELEEEDHIPPLDYVIAQVSNEIHDNFPKVKKENFVQRINSTKMPPTSSWWILWKIHRHSTQAPCCHQHQQIQPRTGKTFHPQNLSQNKGTHI